MPKLIKNHARQRFKDAYYTVLHGQFTAKCYVVAAYFTIINNKRHNKYSHEQLEVLIADVLDFFKETAETQIAHLERLKEKAKRIISISIVFR